MPYHAPGIRGGLLRVIFVVRALLIMRGDCLAVRLPALDGATCSRCRCCGRIGDVYASLRAMMDM